MKGPALVSTPFALVLALTSACASTSRPEPMPAWSPATVELVAASAPGGAGLLADDDDDQDDDEKVWVNDQSMRIPREEEPLPDIWPARGLYLGGALISSQPLGDFDGETAYARGNDIVFIPDIDVGAGGGVYLSYRWHMNEVLLQYSITEHDGDFSGTSIEHDTTFYDLDLNWRHYFWEHSAIQPYALLGLGWARAAIDNGSTDLLTQTLVADAELYNGINVNVGAGAALYTLPWVVFFGQAMYRFVRYESIEGGIDGHGSATPDIDGDGWNISFGAALRLLGPRD